MHVCYARAYERVERALADLLFVCVFNHRLDKNFCRTFWVLFGFANSALISNDFHVIAVRLMYSIIFWAHGADLVFAWNRLKRYHAFFVFGSFIFFIQGFVFFGRISYLGKRGDQWRSQGGAQGARAPPSLGFSFPSGLEHPL